MIKRIPLNFKEIPQKTGIYFFLDKQKQPIYIGKAKNLKKRLLDHKRNKRELLFEKSHFIKFEILPNEIVSLIREAELIKKFQPRFNTAFRDDKKYFYLCFSQEDFPKPFINHQPKDFFLGPFVDGRALKRSLNLSRKFFPFCSCKKPHLQKCLNSQIGRCLGFCCQKITATEEQKQNYQNNIKNIKAIFSGKNLKLKQKLRQEIVKFAEDQNYQKAQALKNQLEGLEKILSHQSAFQKEVPLYSPDKDLQKIFKIKISKIEFFDTSMLQGKDRVGAMVVWQNNDFSKKDWRLFKIKNESARDDLAMMKEILLRRKKHSDWSPADLMIIDGGKNQLKILKNIFPKIQTAGLEKNSKHQPENLLITNPNNKTAKKIKLSTLKPELKNFLEKISEKTHNFAIKFHRKRRDKIKINSF